MVSFVHPKIALDNLGGEAIGNLQFLKDPRLFGMQHHFGPATIIILFLNIANRVPNSGSRTRSNQVNPCSIAEHFGQPVATTTRRNLHNIRLPICAYASFDIIDACLHAKESYQTLDFRL